MKNLLICLALLTATTTACHKDGPPPEPSGAAEPAPAAEPGPAAAGPACQGDSDCIISCARPDECCDQLCPPCNQAFHRDTLAAHEQWRTASCAATSCPVAKCMAPTEETIARCSAGQCVVERRPVAAP